MKTMIEKQEHYAVSDEFMLRYRQKNTSRNGYIMFAHRVGHSTDVDISEPNQKWHFFEAYVIREILNGKYCYNTPAETVYNRIKNPELLLWIAEASGVNSDKVEKLSIIAKQIIDNDSGKNLRNAAGNKIRGELPWNELEALLIQKER